jgi:hypothetical protein
VCDCRQLNIAHHLILKRGQELFCICPLVGRKQLNDRGGRGRPAELLQSWLRQRSLLHSSPEYTIRR